MKWVRLELRLRKRKNFIGIGLFNHASRDPPPAVCPPPETRRPPTNPPSYYISFSIPTFTSDQISVCRSTI